MPYQILRTWDTKRRVEIKAASQNGTSHITRDRWKWFKSWESQNKGHQHLIFDVEDRDRLVRGTFSKVVEETYYKLPVASRPLFARFLLLYVFGGIYADMDTSCHTMFDMWLEGMKGVDVVVGLENEDRISSHVVGAMPGHRFIAKVIEGIVQLLHDKSEKELESDETLDDVLKHGMLTHVVKTYILKQLAASDPWKQISEMQSSNVVIGKTYFE
ncbi:membrane-bound alpha-1,6- mannosyltransferase Initiation-specific, partial [Rhizoclosmatium hyalinum]